MDVEELGVCHPVGRVVGFGALEWRRGDKAGSISASSFCEETSVGSTPAGDNERDCFTLPPPSSSGWFRLQCPYRPGQPMLLKPILKCTYYEVMRFHLRAMARLLDGIPSKRFGRGRVHIKGGARCNVTEQITPLPFLDELSALVPFGFGLHQGRVAHRCSCHWPSSFRSIATLPRSQPRACPWAHARSP